MSYNSAGAFKRRPLMVLRPSRRYDGSWNERASLTQPREPCSAMCDIMVNFHIEPDHAGRLKNTRNIILSVTSVARMRTQGIARTTSIRWNA